jgi:hypothetical protein
MTLYTVLQQDLNLYMDTFQRLTRADRLFLRDSSMKLVQGSWLHPAHLVATNDLTRSGPAGVLAEWQTFTGFMESFLAFFLTGPSTCWLSEEQHAS